MSEFKTCYQMEDIYGDVAEIGGAGCIWFCRFPDWENGGTRVKTFQTEDQAYSFAFRLGFRE